MPKNQSNKKASEIKSKYPKIVSNITWYYLHQDKHTYIIAQLPSTEPSLAHSISVSINRFAKANHLNLHASSQEKNNLLYLYETDFKDYFEAMKITQPAIKEATQKLKDLFNDNKCFSVNTTDRNYLAQLPDFTWYQIEQDKQTYIVTEIPSNKPNLASRINTAINHYAKEKALSLQTLCQMKKNLLYLTEASFKNYFSSIAQHPPTVNQSSAELIAKFSMNGKSKHFASKPHASTREKRKSNHRVNLGGVTWYYLVQDTQTYIVTQLPSTKPSLAHSLSTSINHFGDKNHLSIHASSQQKNNLLYLSETDFKAYFDARNIMLPTIKEADQELKTLFNDNQSSSVTTKDKNYLAQLPSFTWYQLKRKAQTYIVTELPSTLPTQASHTAKAINHYSKEKALQLHASYLRKNNLLYLTESCFAAYFSSINQNPPAVNQPSAALIAKFSPNSRKNHTANTLNKRISPINSSDSQPERLVISEPREQLPNLDATQSSLLDQLSHFISETDDNSSMTIVQSSESLTEDGTLPFDYFDKFDFNELYYVWELDKQAQDGNNRVDEIENSTVDLRQIHLCP